MAYLCDHQSTERVEIYVYIHGFEFRMKCYLPSSQISYNVSCIFWIAESALVDKRSIQSVHGLLMLSSYDEKLIIFHGVFVGGL